MTPKISAAALTIAGALVVCVGIWLIFPPAALIAAGTGLLVFGLLVIDVPEES